MNKNLEILQKIVRFYFPVKHLFKYYPVLFVDPAVTRSYFPLWFPEVIRKKDERKRDSFLLDKPTNHGQTCYTKSQQGLKDH